MAAEMQPRFICGQPTHSAAWEGMKSRPGPPHSTPPQKALGAGRGRETRTWLWGGSFRGAAAQAEEPGVPFGPHALSSCMTLGTPFTPL